MLDRVVSHLDKFGVNVTIFDDGSDFPREDERVIRLPRQGKRNYWKIWDKMLHHAEDNLADLYIFMPDDFQDLDIERIKELHGEFKHSEYIYNLVNDGRLKQWIAFDPKKIDDNTMQIGFTDCGFFCNRPALHTLGFYMKDPRDEWFRQGEHMSSGVGMMLSHRAYRTRIPIYLPSKSLAYHGDHDSVMHPQERKNNPLKSK